MFEEVNGRTNMLNIAYILCPRCLDQMGKELQNDPNKSKLQEPFGLLFIIKVIGQWMEKGV